MSSLRSNTLRSIAWVALTRAVVQPISFIVGIILARLLAPEDFGIVAMALAFTGLAGLFANLGLTASLIQRQNITDTHLSTVFWFNLAAALLLASILYSSSDLIAGVYGNTSVSLVVKLLSVNFIINAFRSIPGTIFSKALNFKYISIAEICALLLSSAVAIYLAIKGYGLLALVAHSIIQNIIATVILFSASKWKPSFYFSFYALQELFGFSLKVFLTSLLRFFSDQLDKFLLGRYVGAQALGIYDRAYTIMIFPLTNISQVISRVMFPSLSLIQHDKPRIKKIYLRSTRTIALATFPMMMGMFIVADDFIGVVLGKQWLDTIPILRALCLAGLIRSIVTVTGSVYLASGAAGLQLKVNVVTKLITLVLFLTGIGYGLNGIVLAFVTSTVINSFITLSVAGRLIDLSIFELLHSFSPIFFSSLFMGVFVFVISVPMMDYLPAVRLATQIALGTTVYCLTLYVFRVNALQDVLEIIRPKLIQFFDKRWIN